MDKNRLKQLGGGDGAGSEKAKIIVMFFLLVGIIGGYIYMQTSSPDVERPSYQNVERQPLAELQVRREPGGKADPDRLALVSEDQSVVRETEPYRHLLEEARKLVPGDMEALGAIPAPYDSLLRSPAEYRAQPVWVKGVVEWIEPHEADGQTEYRGILQTQEKHRFFFTVTDNPSRDLGAGDVVKLEGFFFKLFTHIGPNNQMDRNLPYVVGQRLIESMWSIPKVTAVDIDLMSQVRDESAREMTEDVELDPESPLWHAMSFVQHGDLEAYDEFARDLKHGQIMHNASELRGAPIHITGRYGQSWVDLLGQGGENPIDVRRGYHFLLYHSGEKLTYAISTKPPPEWLNPDDLVTIKGIFVKKYAWETKDRGVFSGPLLVVYDFEAWEMPKQLYSSTVIYVVLGLIGLFIVGFVVAVYGDRRGAKNFRSQFHERRRRMRDAKKIDLKEISAAVENQNDAGSEGDEGVSKS